MKFAIQTIAISLTALILELFLPWYGIALAAFTFGYSLKSNANFLAGFIGITLTWGFQILRLDLQAATELTQSVASIVGLKEKYQLIVITLLLGGLIGGMAALTGSLLNQERKYSH